MRTSFFRYLRVWRRGGAGDNVSMRGYGLRGCVSSLSLSCPRRGGESVERLKFSFWGRDWDSPVFGIWCTPQGAEIATIALLFQWGRVAVGRAHVSASGNKKTKNREAGDKNPWPMLCVVGRKEGSGVEIW